MDSRRRRSPGSANTRAPIQRRSSEPSGDRAPAPNASAIRARVAEPGATTARASASASTTGTPRARSRAEKVLLPEAMPPVRPTSRTRSLPAGRGLLAAGLRAGGPGLGGGPGALGPGPGTGLGRAEGERLGAGAVLGPVDGDPLAGIDPDLLEGVLDERLLGRLAVGALDGLGIERGHEEDGDLLDGPGRVHVELGLLGSLQRLIPEVGQDGARATLGPGGGLPEPLHHVRLLRGARVDALPGARLGQ